MLDYPPIRTLLPDQVITEPGFYDIPMDRHHGQPCDGFSVTSSGLRRALLHSPAEFWAAHPLNPQAELIPDRPALRMGRAMAAFIEGGIDGVAEQFVQIKPGAPPRPTAPQVAAFERTGKWSPAAQERADYWEAIDADGRTPLPAEEYTLILRMGAALAAHPASVAALSQQPEVTMAYRDERTGIWCLSRPDQFSFSGMLADYKKVHLKGAMHPGALSKLIEDHGYDMQMAFGAEAFQQITGQQVTSVGLIFQSDAPPYPPYPMGLTDEALFGGMRMNRIALDLIHEGLTTGRWMLPDELRERVYGEQPEFHPSTSRRLFFERLENRSQ